MSDSLQPIARSPLYEQVAERLREFIRESDLQPGDRLLAERDLAERLGVSRTSVRQALTALRVMGIVDIRHGDGVYLLESPSDLVPSLASEVARAGVDHPMIWEVREGIEVQAALLAARRRSDADLQAMRTALADMERSIGGGGDGIDGDRLFHRAIFAATDNRFLSVLVEQIADALDRTSEASLTLPGRAPVSLAAHRQILAAIEQHDEAAAAAAMREHIHVSTQMVTARTASDA